MPPFCCLLLSAQLKANLVGTEYLLRGRGGDSSAHKGFNAQLLAVNFKPTINHIAAAPRTMTATLPVPESKVSCLQGCRQPVFGLGRLAHTGRTDRPPRLY